jgi:hypothetical protein
MNTSQNAPVDKSAPSPAPPPRNGHGDTTAVKISKAARRGKKKRPSGKKPAQKRRSFPNSSFEDALTIAQVIQTIGAGNRMRRLTIFNSLQKSPDSGSSRMMVINSARYGLTIGGYQADYIELTPKGRIASDPEGNPKERLKARFDLAVSEVEPFKFLYDRLAGNKLPTQNAGGDAFRSRDALQSTDRDAGTCCDRP